MEEINIKLDGGLVSNINPIDTSVLTFSDLQGVYNKDGSLYVSSFLKPFAKLGTNEEKVVDSFFAVSNPVSKQNYLGIKIDNAVYTPVLKDSSGSYELQKVRDLRRGADDIVQLTGGPLVNNTPLYEDLDPYSIMQSAQWIWTNISTVFFTKPLLPLHKLVLPTEITATDEEHSIEIKNITDTSVGGTPAGIPFNVKGVEPTYRDESNEPVYLSAKYILVTNDRLFLGNCYENSNHFSTRIHWSDINKPENWAIESTSEADYFDLGINSLEITGLAYISGTVIIFSRNSIWRSDYESFDTKFRTTKLTSNTGCSFHYSAVTVNEVVYFIGKDNFYSLEELTLQPIGSLIWDWFVENVDLDFNYPIPAYYDAETDSVNWSVKFKVTSPLYGGSINDTCLVQYSLKTKTWAYKKIKVLA